MKKAAQVVSMAALLVTILPAALFFADRLSLAQSKWWMLAGAVAWFLSAPLWMERKVGK
jgi:hypothetical protein